MRYKCWFFVGLLGLLWSQLTLGKSLLHEGYNKPSLQRGAKLFMNYCSGCHSLKYLRYNHMAEGLGLLKGDGQVDEDLLKNNLIFTQALLSDSIRIALPSEDAKHWFGVVPPDLSLVAKEKGRVWLHKYLSSFYKDDSRPFGSNNLLVPGVAMPNVLAPLLGDMILVRNNHGRSDSLLVVQEGELSQAQIDFFLQDLVNFLDFASEPSKIIRYRMGFWVMIFLFIFLLVALSLKRAYWKKTA